MKKYQQVINQYRELYFERYQVQPEINYPQCMKLLKERCANNEESVVCKIIELYFENESKVQVMHLPSILSSYAFNKYLPMVKQKVENEFLND
jgi:hypothetical protein